MCNQNHRWAAWIQMCRAIGTHFPRQSNQNLHTSKFCGGFVLVFISFSSSLRVACWSYVLPSVLRVQALFYFCKSNFCVGGIATTICNAGGSAPTQASLPLQNYAKVQLCAKAILSCACLKAVKISDSKAMTCSMDNSLNRSLLVKFL